MPEKYNIYLDLIILQRGVIFEKCKSNFGGKCGAPVKVFQSREFPLYYKPPNAEADSNVPSNMKVKCKFSCDAECVSDTVFFISIVERGFSFSNEEFVKKLW